MRKMRNTLKLLFRKPQVKKLTGDRCWYENNNNKTYVQEENAKA
jgi:hypothetical protein